MSSFTSEHIDENCEALKGTFENSLFFNCTFKDLRGLTLKDCVLRHSKFITDSLPQALGLTMSLDCNSFDNVEYSELLFDLFLVLAIKSKGNTEKRRKLIELLGKERVFELLQLLENLDK